MASVVRNGVYYHSGTTCGECDTTKCSSCSGPAATECYSCKVGYFLKDDGECVATCPAGTYSDATDASNPVCLKCDYRCVTCTGATNTACESCIKTKTIETVTNTDTFASSTSAEKYYYDTLNGRTTCASTCSEGQILDETTDASQYLCRNCIEWIWDEYTACSLTEDGYAYVWNNKCHFRCV